LEEPLRNQLRKKLRSSLKAEINQFENNPASFIFSSHRPTYLNPLALNQRLDQEWEERRDLWASEETAPLQEIFFPSSPYTLKIIEQVYLLDYTLSIDQPSILLDLGVLYILKAVITEGHDPVSPQLFIELLNCYNERVPELLVLGNILFQIILKDHPTLKQEIKNRTCAVLINHFEIEALFIFIAGHPGLEERDKQILFQSLTAFQKIYRKFLELQEEIGNKDQISQKWFGEDFDHLKKSPRFQDNFLLLVNLFHHLIEDQKSDEALSLGRYLVLRFNNEDILRHLHGLMQREAINDKADLQQDVYRLIYFIMQDFRKEYIPQAVDSALTNTLSEMETQARESMRMITIGQVPAQIILQGMEKEGLPPQSQYSLTPQLAEKFRQYHLTLLFDLYPIPPAAQEILSVVSRIAENLELKKDDLVRFIAYLERLLIFLQQLEEMGLRILPGPRYGVILNPFQLSSFSLIQEGAYFASTGYWLRSRVPPAVIRCISPRAIPNCLGILDRHIFSRISLLSGAFRGTPFDLDSTNRYDWDEEPETCQIRPGYFLLDIPPLLAQAWEKSQSLQKEALQEKIRKKDWV
jgi:hypothetical protein